MRRCSSLCSVLLGGGTFALLAVACGHTIDKSNTSTTSGGTSSTGTTTSSSNGGASTTTGCGLECPEGGAGNTDTGTSTDGGTDAGGECPAAQMPAEDSRPGYNVDAAREQKVADLLKEMSLDNKIKQMIGIPTPKTDAAGNFPGEVWMDIERSEDAETSDGTKVRGYRYRDAGRGVNLDAGQDNRKTQDKDYATAFPTPSIRAASWDVALEMRLGEAMGDETMGSKNNLLLAPCMNIIRHPFWGRTQETYGEDMYHTGRMASAYTAGLQKHVVACAKHYAANNIENGRDNQNAEMDEQTLREVYAQHFDMVIREGGVGCIMASYNSINKKKSTQNKHLLTDLLRTPVDQGGMGYRGFVITDWWAMPGSKAILDNSLAKAQTLEAVEAGLDLEVPWALNFNQLKTLVDGGQLTTKQIDTAAGRILEQKFRFNTVWGDGTSNDPWGLGTAKTSLSGDSITNNDDSLALAEESEIKSAVLLKNGTGDAATTVLPIKTDDVKSIAVVGLEVTVTVHAETSLPVTGDKLNFATTVNVGDRGSSRVNPDPDKSISPYDGIKSVADGKGITNVTSGTSADAAKDADFVVVVVGLTAGNEGEEYSIADRDDRKTLTLPDNQEELVQKVLDLDKPTAIIIESGSIVNVPWLSHKNKKQATIWAGYPGQRGGTALGKLLLGDANFSGKLPLAWPEESVLLPFRDGKENTTKMGYFHGYREFDRRKAMDEPMGGNIIFPFGHGLSYTNFKYAELKAPGSCGSISKTGVVNFTVKVSNEGSVAGDEIIMLFVKGPKAPSKESGKARPVKELKRFHKASIAAGESKTITLPVSIQDLRHWEGDEKGKWVVDEGEYTFMVGPSGDDAALTQQLKIKVHG